MALFLNSGLSLYEWVVQEPKESFPLQKDYASRLRLIREHLVEHIYPHVVSGTLLATIVAGDDPIYLNDHGINHSLQVIERASALIKQADYNIKPYDAYLLTVAILLHDLGNIFGRAEHERKCGELFDALGTAVISDTAERRIILRIAAAHGGKIGDDKDTIGALQRSFPLFRESINKQFIAAILRFSDELADDRSRASRFFLDHQTLVPGSVLFHAYSDSLRSVQISRSDISLHFEIGKSRLLQKFPKGTAETYLIDEIFVRSLKMHVENIYCMRFLRPSIYIENIRVAIQFFDDAFQNEIREPVSYSLKESGYPILSTNSIVSLCPNLEGVTGSSIAAQLQ